MNILIMFWLIFHLCVRLCMYVHGGSVLILILKFSVNMISFDGFVSHITVDENCIFFNCENNTPTGTLQLM